MIKVGKIQVSGIKIIIGILWGDAYNKYKNEADPNNQEA
jgi:hypothetical protein